MRRFAESLYAKLAAVILVVIAVLGVVLAVIWTQSVLRFVDETEQSLNQNLAAELAAEFEPLLQEKIDKMGVMQRIEYMMGINPRIEMYLLDRTGAITSSFLESDEPVEKEHVSLAPIQQFLAGDALPILGDDPLHAVRQKPFSVAPINVMGDSYYLYVILGSERYDSAAAMIQDSYIAKVTLEVLGLILLFAVLVALVAMALLTRRLREMKQVVTAFEAGALDRRIRVGPPDEIGKLASSFNQMADSLEAMLDELKQADRLRRELVANVSHDLRSPLASMLGYLETIQMKVGTLDEEEQHQYLATVMKSAERLGGLIDELFELSKLDAQQVQPHCEPFPLAELVQDIVLQFDQTAEAEGIALEAKLPSTLPHVFADIGLIERTLSNLIENAIRYTPRGGSVCVQVEPSEETIRVCVRDTGQGIPAEDVPHIFDRFYRVEKSRSREEGGTGLGLSIAQKILELHASKLLVESEEGQGTSFFFDLPLAHSFTGQRQQAQLV